MNYIAKGRRSFAPRRTPNRSPPKPIGPRAPWNGSPSRRSGRDRAGRAAEIIRTTSLHALLIHLVRPPLGDPVSSVARIRAGCLRGHSALISRLTTSRDNERALDCTRSSLAEQFHTPQWPNNAMALSRKGGFGRPTEREWGSPAATLVSEQENPPCESISSAMRESRCVASPLFLLTSPAR
jgi:hypothetical protein